MKLVKRLLVVFMILLFLILGSVFVLVTFYKKEIITHLTDHLKESYGIALKADNVQVSLFSNWPNASVELEKVTLINTNCEHEPLLNASSLSLALNLQDLLKKQFVVKSVALKNASINLVRTANGIKNFEFKKRDTASTSKSSLNFEIKKVALKNINFAFLNKQRNKKIEFKLVENTVLLKNYADGADAKILGNLLIQGLLFKEKKGPFLSNTEANIDLNARVCFKRGEIFVYSPSKVVIQKQTYNLSAFVDLNENKKIVLSVKAKGVNFQSGIGLLNSGIKKGLSSINVEKPLDVDALVVAPIDVQEDPIILVKANSSSNNVTIGNSKIPYNDVSFSALVISLDSSQTKGNSETAKVVLKPIKGKIYEFPFTGNVTIQNFDNPFITINAELFIEANKMPFKPGQEFVLNGNASAKVNYSGPVSHLNQKLFLDDPMRLNANVMFNDVSYKEKTKPYVYKVNGKAIVTNKQLSFDKLNLKLNGGNFTLKGYVDNFIKYALGYTNGFKASLNASTGIFDLTSYVVPQDAPKANSKSQQTIEEKVKSVSDESSFEFDVALSAKKLLIRKVKADNAVISLHYKNKLLELKALKVNTCGGSLAAKGTIYNLHNIDADVTTQDINVTEMFNQFENFGQKAVVSNNLKGNISLEAKVKMNLDEKMEVIGNSIKGNVHLKLRDGHLLNYEPLQNVSDYIFKNRDFKDISFTEIDETFAIDGFKMDIQELEIASNVLNLFVSGTYHFKEHSNINLLIPWNNLKKRGKNYIPKSSGQSAENSKGLKLNYSGYPDKLKLTLGNK